MIPVLKYGKHIRGILGYLMVSVSLFFFDRALPKTLKQVRDATMRRVVVLLCGQNTKLVREATIRSVLVFHCGQNTKLVRDATMRSVAGFNIKKPNTIK